MNGIKKIKAFLNKNFKKIFFKKREEFYVKYPISLSKRIIENSIAISLKNNYWYCRIYKSANSTVVASLYNAETNIKIKDVNELQPIKDDYFLSPNCLSKKQINLIGDLYKFSFVRNPYDRIWSAYLDKIDNLDSSQRKLVTNFYSRELDAKISFEEFLTYLENGGISTNGHWARQVDFLVLPISEYDFIGKVENLNPELESVLKHIYGEDLPVINVLSHSTKSKRNSSLPTKYYNRVYKLYEEDFKSLNYSK